MPLAVLLTFMLIIVGILLRTIVKDTMTMMMMLMIGSGPAQSVP
ncbi:MAG: hypothetical protein P4M09_18120 [Devosia sp.]|nr:hypothetical protein [Devosia sp.]